MTIGRSWSRLTNHRHAWRNYYGLRIPHVVGFLEINIDQFLGIDGIEAQVFRHVDKGVARLVGHAFRVEPAQAQHPHDLFFRIERLLPPLARWAWLCNWRRRRHS